MSRGETRRLCRVFRHPPPPLRVLSVLQVRQEAMEGL